VLNELFHRAVLLTQESDKAPAIEAWEAVMAHPGYHTLSFRAQWTALAELGAFRLERYDAHARIDDLAGALTYLEGAVKLSDAVPPEAQAMGRYNLAQAQERRYHHSRNAEDLLTAARSMWGLVDTPPPRTSAQSICLWVAGLIEEHDGDLPAALRQLRVTVLERLLTYSSAPDDARYSLALAHALVNLMPQDPVEQRSMVARAVVLAEQSQSLLPEGDLRRTAITLAEKYRAFLEWIDQNAPPPVAPGRPEQTNLFDWVDGLSVIPDREVRLSRIREAMEQNPYDVAGDAWVLLSIALAEEILDDDTNQKIETDEAITALHAALDLTEGPAALIRLELQFNLGMAYRRRRAGNPSDNEREARKLFDKCLQGAEPGDSLHSHLALAFARMARDDRQGSQSSEVNRAILLCRDALTAMPPDEDRALQGRLWDALAVLLSRRTHGDFGANIEEAIAAGHRALDLLSGAENVVELGNVHHNLAGLYRERLTGGREANLWQAIEHYQAALVAQPKATMPVDWAMTQSALGVAYSMMRGRDVEATQRQSVEAFLAALSVFTLNDHPRDWAMAEFGLGVALGDLEVREQPDPEQAIAHLMSCLQVFTEETSPWMWAQTHLFLGVMRMQLESAEQLTAAAEHFRAALRVITLEHAPRDYAIAQLNLAQLTSPENLASHQATIRALTEHGRRDEAFKAWMLQVRYLRKQQDWTGAADAGARAADLHESLYQEALLRQSRHLEQRAASLDLLEIVTVMLRAGRTLDGVLLLERTRARELGEALGQEHDGFTQARQTHPQAFAAFRAAADQLAKLSSAERSVAAAAFDPGEQERLHLLLVRAMTRARTEYDAALARLRGVAGILGPPGIGELSSALTPHRPLVYVYVFQAVAHLVLVRRDSDYGLDIACRTADVHDIAAYEAVASLLEGITKELGAWLRELEVEEVSLIACGLVSRWPLHAVPSSDGRCLVDDFRISYTPSAAVLARRPAPRPGPAVLVAVGNPTADLPFASVEVSAAAALGGWSRSVVRHGMEATPEAFEEDLRAATHVHLACHGDFDAARPLESAFLLAGGARLTLRRIITQRSFKGVRLVFASACNTAYTDTFVPDESIGLAAGLLQAGANEVIASLWKVDDRATMLLATRFHADLDSGTGRALQSAQLWLRDSTAAEFARWCRHLADAIDDSPYSDRLNDAVAFFEDQPSNERCYANPRYWAAFVHLGT
jgi:CHAT domain-containing protein/tetratricopeptide (TPR) repeat protein